MKKILLASTIALSMAGIAKSPAFAEENKATNRTQTSEQTVSNSVGKEEQKQSSSRDKDPNQSANEGLNKTEKESSQDGSKKESSENKEKASTKANVEEVNKEGWQKENDQWRYYENNKAITNWKKIAGHWYYFNKNGVMLSDTIYDGYLLNKSGAVVEDSWLKIGEKWYYASDSGKVTRNKWEKINGSWYVFDKDGVMLSSQWKDKYYLKDSGAMAHREWFFDKKYNSWFYLKSDGSYAENQWQGSYYLKSYGYMAKNEWIFDPHYNAWYYLKEDGVYVTGTYTINGKEYSFLSNGKWISDSSAYYKVKPITANVYNASGEKLSYISQGSIVSIDGSEEIDGRLPVKISGLSGYMNKSDLVAVSSDSDFIPHYVTDGKYLYHELSPSTSIRVAPYNSSLEIGKKYYSADGINF